LEGKSYLGDLNINVRRISKGIIKAHAYDVKLWSGYSRTGSLMTISFPSKAVLH
jgi:hypothetical protein